MKRDETERTYTFGNVLCSEEDGASIDIDDVDVDVLPTSEDSPVDVEVLFRTHAVDDAGPTDPTRAEMAIDSLRGRPEGQLTGTFTRTLDEPVVQSCDEAWSRKGAADRIEMLTVVTAGREGALVTRRVINYHVGRLSYAHEVDWQVGVCGPVVPEDFGCGPWR